MTAAANDNAPTTIALGTTFESATWRAHRYSDNIVVTDLRGAGKVGKRCAVFTVFAFNAEDVLDTIAPVVAWAVQEGATVETMRAMLADVVLSGCTFTEDEKRGVDVPRLPTIEVKGELMDGTFTETKALLCFSFFLDGKSGMKQDTIVATEKRADAARAYAWAQQNATRLPAMTLGQFRAEMSAIGARVV